MVFGASKILSVIVPFIIINFYWSILLAKVVNEKYNNSNMEDTNEEDVKESEIDYSLGGASVVTQENKNTSEN